LTPTASPLPAIPTALPTTAIGDNFRWIDVDLTHQRLIAYEGETPARTVIVSTGLPRTPTVTGRFQVYVKYKAVHMSGVGYNLPNVPYVMYFYRGYALHGTYWHTNFGQPMSHGCVNLPTPDAEWLYNWASVGTLVFVHY
jgi:lipoprotein-anchoring transpeptidase ErfK/SrfK